ncbi:MAG: efflux RND transporter periplasmic adaptor subunit [Vicinamibacterales bacterium]
MKIESRRTVIVAVVISLVLGAAITYLIMRPASSETAAASEPATPQQADSMAGMPGMAANPSAGTATTTGPAVVSLTREAIERAGIVVTAVTAGGGAASVRIPGTVEPNAYRAVVVTPVVSGRVTRVNVQLGDQVRRGQTIAQIYSPQLAAAQTRYLSIRAELDAATQQLRRTERLVEIGAASRQELEQVRADQTTRATAVEGARSQLVLLGVTSGAIGALSAPSEISATTNVPAPIDGVLTARAANIGLNVDPTTELFTVVDLSTVWIVGDLYEKDFSRVRVGSPAEITTTAYPDVVLRGKVSYIDPEVNAQTRTARVRVEVRNLDRRLRLGMFADMQFSDADGARMAMVPRSAVQRLGGRSVVYVVDGKQPGQFLEREVTLGNMSGDHVEVLSGVTAGEDVVAEGSFFVRAERERVNPSGITPSATEASAAAPAAPSREPVIPPIVKVTERGFEPDRVIVPKGAPTTVTFVRTTDKTCATEIVIPTQGIKQELPLNKPVTIEFKRANGEVAFACGMNMFKGSIVVQ